MFRQRVRIRRRQCTLMIKILIILKKNLRLLTPNRAIQMKYLIWK